MKNGTGTGAFTSVRKLNEFNPANTPLLKVILELYNRPIFNKASKIYNAKGEAATIEYMRQYTTAMLEVMGIE